MDERPRICSECRTRTEFKKVTVEYERNGIKVQILDVPAMVCPNCGRRSFLPGVADKIIVYALLYYTFERKVGMVHGQSKHLGNLPFALGPQAQAPGTLGPTAQAPGPLAQGQRGRRALSQGLGPKDQRPSLTPDRQIRRCLVMFYGARSGDPARARIMSCSLVNHAGESNG